MQNKIITITYLERIYKMFALIATKPLNDDTNGFRFNVLGLKGLTRKRITKSRG